MHLAEIFSPKTPIFLIPNFNTYASQYIVSLSLIEYFFVLMPFLGFNFRLRRMSLS